MQKHMHNPENEINGDCGGKRYLKKLISQIFLLKVDIWGFEF